MAIELGFFLAADLLLPTKYSSFLFSTGFFLADFKDLCEDSLDLAVERGAEDCRDLAIDGDRVLSALTMVGWLTFGFSIGFFLTTVVVFVSRGFSKTGRDSLGFLKSFATGCETFASLLLLLFLLVGFLVVLGFLGSTGDAFLAVKSLKKSR
jgi:hypothetical protein